MNIQRSLLVGILLLCFLPQTSSNYRVDTPQTSIDIYAISDSPYQYSDLLISNDISVDISGIYYIWFNFTGYESPQNRTGQIYYFINAEIFELDFNFPIPIVIDKDTTYVFSILYIMADDYKISTIYINTQKEIIKQELDFNIDKGNENSLILDSGLTQIQLNITLQNNIENIFIFDMSGLHKLDGSIRLIPGVNILGVYNFETKGSCNISTIYNTGFYRDGTHFNLTDMYCYDVEGIMTSHEYYLHSTRTDYTPFLPSITPLLIILLLRRRKN